MNMNAIIKIIGLRVALMALAASLPLTAQAQGADSSDVSVSGNVAVTNDYLFRGISQTWGDPALQGGVDVTEGRWHVGAWTSNVSRNSYPGGGGELDLYGDVGLFSHGDWSLRGGLYSYLYPGANLDHARPALGDRSLDTLEANLSLQWKDWTLKYSRSLTDYFGADAEQGYTGDTRGTQYLQLDGNLPLGQQWSLQLHAAYTAYGAELRVPLVNGADDASYTDYGIGVKYAPTSKFFVSLGVSHACNDAFYGHVVSFRDAQSSSDLGGTRVVLTLATTF